MRPALRRPYLWASVTAHAVLLGLLYRFGGHELSQREQDEEVASSLRATSQASMAKRLQDLQTIKSLLEKSADRTDTATAPAPASAAPPETPEQALTQARELSRSIETLDREIEAEELRQLTGAPKPPPAASQAAAAAAVAMDAPSSDAMDAAAARHQPERQGKSDRVASASSSSRPASGTAPAALTPEKASGEIATLEDKARATLTKRLQRLEAKANGVQIDGADSGRREQRPGAATADRQRRTDSSVRAQIADFINARTKVEARSAGYSGFRSDFFDHGAVRIPPVEAAHTVLGRGRTIGAGGEFANRIYLNSWYIIGPFAGRHGADLFHNPAYPPEEAVLLDAVYYGKDQRLLRWRYVTATSYPLVPPDMVEDSVYYGYTEVHVDEDRDMTAWIGADDDVQILLNDHLVWAGGNVGKQTYFDAIFNADQGYLENYNRTEGRRVLHFNKGRNRLFFKLSNGPNSAFLSFVLTP